PALGIHLGAERVAASFGEDLEHLRLRVITPDVLPLELYVLRYPTADITRRRAADRSIHPTVRAQQQTVRNRMGIFQAETAQAHLGIAVGYIVVVRIGIKQQEGRVEDPYSPSAFDRCRCQVETGNYIPV